MAGDSDRPVFMVTTRWVSWTELLDGIVENVLEAWYDRHKMFGTRAILSGGSFSYPDINPPQTAAVPH